MTREKGQRTDEDRRKRREYQRQRCESVRAELFALLGGVCQFCRVETDIRCINFVSASGSNKEIRNPKGSIKTNYANFAVRQLKRYKKNKSSVKAKCVRCHAISEHERRIAERLV